MSSIDIVRVLRIIEYVGPRDRVEAQLQHSIIGVRTFYAAGRSVQVRATTMPGYPEILDSEDLRVNLEETVAKHKEILASKPTIEGKNA